MRPHHAAALALIGWYLMVPPIVYHGNKEFAHTDAPLSEWDSYAAYDSASECEQELAKLIEKDVRDKRNSIMPFARCIAADDPRLKGN